MFGKHYKIILQNKVFKGKNPVRLLRRVVNKCNPPNDAAIGFIFYDKSGLEINNFAVTPDELPLLLNSLYNKSRELSCENKKGREEELLDCDNCPIRDFCPIRVEVEELKALGKFLSLFQ